MLGILPFVSGSDVSEYFWKRTRETGTEKFFTKVNSRARSTKQKKCAFFNMEGTLVDADLASSVFAYQVRMLDFAFVSKDVPTLFGLGPAKGWCTPTVVQWKDADRVVKVDFEILLSEIETMFATYMAMSASERASSGKYQIRLKTLIAVWGNLSLAHMQNEDVIEDCRYLSKTFRYRLLYGMSMEKRKEMMENVLREKPSQRADSYIYDGISVEIPTSNPAVYEEQKALLAVLKKAKVISFVISDMATPYLDTLITYYKLDILSEYAQGTFDDKNMLAVDGYTNYGEGKKRTMQDIMKTHSCTAFFASGDSIGDYEILQFVLDNGGFVFVQKGLEFDEKLNFGTGNPESVRIQEVTVQPPSWINKDASVHKAI